MKTIFTPNGTGSYQVILNLAREEFGDKITDSKSYLGLKKDIIRVLRSLSHDELEENRLDTLVGIKHLQENDFGNFISVRFAYWGMMLTMAIMIIGDIPIYTYFSMDKKQFAWMAIVALILILVTMSRTIHQQHDQLEYLNFKMICFEEIMNR